MVWKKSQMFSSDLSTSRNLIFSNFCHVLSLKTKNYFDVQQQIQFSPGIYELYDRDKLLKSEHMDFQTHLYKFGEMENYLREAGFTEIKTYSSFEKEIAIDDCCDMFLFECNL